MQLAQLPRGELGEFPFKGPFGGIIADQAEHVIEQFAGFTDAANMMCRKGQVVVRPALIILPPLPGHSITRIMDLVGKIEDQNWTPLTLDANSPPFLEPILGIADFFEVGGNRLQTIMTPTRFILWDGTSWVTMSDKLTGSITDHYSWTVVANKLCFCQGRDKVQLWDGSTASSGDASADAVPAKYLMELNTYLLAMNTIEGGNPAMQRVRWTAPGDPTDWTSLSAGQTDLFNAFGPINGCVKLYQSGFALQQFGFTQIFPTGSGLQPFYFIPVVATRGRGLAVPLSAASDGESVLAYVGKDNVYVFDGTQAQAIGDMPVQGRLRVGARRRILADLFASDLTQAVGFISTSISGNDFNCYWLFIPKVATWIYNFDEQNWMRFDWASVPSAAGVFNSKSLIRIKDLIGMISEQNWTPDSMNNVNPLDSVAIGFTDGTVAEMKFTGVSERPWSLSGQWQMNDFRHGKSITKLRLVATDVGASHFVITLSNERGQVIQIPVDLGSGRGTSVEEVVPVPGKISGMFINWKLEGEAGIPLALSEITPVFDVAGEYRNT